MTRPPKPDRRDYLDEDGRILYRAWDNDWLEYERLLNEYNYERPPKIKLLHLHRVGRGYTGRLGWKLNWIRSDKCNEPFMCRVIYEGLNLEEALRS